MFFLCLSPKNLSAFCTHQHALIRTVLNKCVFTLRQGYVRERELYGFEDMVDGRGGCELTPFALLLPVYPAILPSLSFAQRDFVHNVIRDRAISLFDMFHKIKKVQRRM